MCWFPLFSVFPDQTFIVSRLKCCAFADFVLIKVVPAQGKSFSGLRDERDLIHTLKYDKKDGLAVQVYHGWSNWITYNWKGMINFGVCVHNSWWDVYSISIISKYPAFASILPFSYGKIPNLTSTWICCFSSFKHICLQGAWRWGNVSVFICTYNTHTDTHTQHPKRKMIECLLEVHKTHVGSLGKPPCTRLRV